MLKKIIYSVFLFCNLTHAQTLTFDEFLGFSDGILNRDAVIQLKDLFPEKFVITSMDFGDFSGDNITDFAIAIRPLRVKGKNIFVYLFCDSIDNYVPVYCDTLEFFELPIEIAFNISDNVCFITQKMKEKSWSFVGYTFLKNELSLVDFYSTGTSLINKKNMVGTENYRNYKDLNSFTGFFNLNNLKEFKKCTFFYHPVYDLKRNVYMGYKKDIDINNIWLWSDSVQEEIKYGSLALNRNNGTLIFKMDLNHTFSSLIDSNSSITFRVYFDRSGERIHFPSPKKDPLFRESLDADIGWINLTLTDTGIISNEIKFGKNYNLMSVGNTDFKVIKNDLIHLILEIPERLFNIEHLSEMGLFLSIQSRMKDGNNIILKNSNGSFNDPSSYAKIIFLNENEFYGSVKNSKFKELTEKLSKNGLNVQIKIFRF